VPPPPRSLRWLIRQQDADGGFNFATAPGQSDVDDTGAVLEALAGTGHHRAIRRAVRFLRHQQNRNGGWPSLPGSISNAQSTAFAIQGLEAVGASLASLRHSPLAYLQSLIAPDGHVAYARGQSQTPVWVTAQAELALLGKPLPLAAVTPARVVPVSHKPPVRRTPVVAHHRHATRARHVTHYVRPRRRRSHPPNRGATVRFAADAGALSALLLAPLDM
jgi:prenyltransferase beta subunit